MKILHLSDTPLSGSPVRIAELLRKHTEHEAHHLVWHASYGYRTFKTDLVGEEMALDDLETALDWADVLHFHNRWRRQIIFQKHPELTQYLKKKSVIQIHSPRFSEDFTDEVLSGHPLAVIAQYHTRQWPELRFVVPNVVDISSDEYRRWPPEMVKVPTVSYAPSNIHAKEWDNKGYFVVNPVLRKMMMARQIHYQLIMQKPHEEVMALKRKADIGIDEFMTGSYHLSSLEYLGLGVATIGNLDELTTKTVCDLTGCRAGELPWIHVPHGTFPTMLAQLLSTGKWLDAGVHGKAWMTTYWNPKVLSDHYIRMYEQL